MKTSKDIKADFQEKYPIILNNNRKGLFDGVRHTNFSEESVTKLVDFVYGYSGADKPVVFIARNPMETQLIYRAIEDNMASMETVIKILWEERNPGKSFDRIDLEDFWLNGQLLSDLQNRIDKEVDSSVQATIFQNCVTDLEDEISNKISSLGMKAINDNLVSSLTPNMHKEAQEFFKGQLTSKLSIALNAEVNPTATSFVEPKEFTEFTPSFGMGLDIINVGFIALHRALIDLFELKLEDTIETFETFESLFKQSGMYTGIFNSKFCIVCPLPKMVHTNADDMLHNVYGPVVEWEGPGYDVLKPYRVNGRSISKSERWLLDDANPKNNSEYYSKFISEKNEDVKSIMVTVIRERHGAEGLLDFLGAVLVDEQEVVHNNDYREILRLYKTKSKFSFVMNRHGDMNQPYCWSEFKCPSTGQTYLIENCASFDDAVEAAKFLRPTFVPDDIEYRWNAFAN